MPKMNRQTMFLCLVLAASCALVAVVVTQSIGERPARPPQSLADIPFDGAKAYQHLQDICALGRRVSGSPGMTAQQQLATKHFQKFGAEVELQKFEIRHPQSGARVPMANLIARWHPERKERVMLCAHYDTRPFPDRDPNNPRGTFIGANDGASGVAVLMQMAAQMPKLGGHCGVDFVLFDGEEFVFGENDPYFLGSTYFAQQYVAQRKVHYRWAVLLDMVGDANLNILQDQASLSWPDSVPLVRDIWGTARRLKVDDFMYRAGASVRDDHVALHDIGGISACDIIDFDYPFWHTQDDVPEKCSALSLAKVGWVIREWLADEVK